MQKDIINQNTDQYDIIDVSCSCGWEGIALIPDLKRDYYALCKKCGKKIYGVNCPKCETGYAYPEDDKDVNKEQMTWKCCGWIPLSHDAQNNFCESYNNEKELPEEIRIELQQRHKQDGKSLLPLKIIMWLVVGVIFYFFAKDMIKDITGIFGL